MRSALILVVVLVSACAGKGGVWPSLARRPIEGSVPITAAVPTDPSVTVAAFAVSPPAVVTPPPAVAAPPPTVADVAARLAIIERDRADLATRVLAQLAMTRRAAAARGSRNEGDAWSKAQLETTRLDRLGNQAGDLHDRLNIIAGMLAEAGAAGADIASPLKATGQAIDRVRALEAEVAAGMAGESSAKR